MRNRPRTIGALAVAVLAAAAPVAAGPPAVHAIEGVRIVVAPGRVVERGTVVVRDGVIEAASANAATPPDARVWDGEGLTIYPGLIDPYVTRTLPELEDNDQPADSHPNALVLAERSAAPWASDESAAGKLRRAGVTTALVAPDQGLFRGTAALVNLGDGGPRENLLRRDVAQAAAIARQSSYPNSDMGAVALLRQALIDAAWYDRAQDAYRRNPAQARPPADASLAALAPVAAARVPLLYDSDDPEDSLRTIAIARELGVDLWLVGHGREYQRLAALAAGGVPHLLPVDFPDAPVVDGDDDLDVELTTLRHWDRAPGNPSALIGAGVRVAFTAHGLSDPAALHGNLAKAIERGLTPDQALAGLTTTPAELIGIADRAGTVEVGKMANLVEVEGDLFVDKPKVRAVWIDGQRYVLEEIKPPEVDPVGTWDLAIQAGPQQISVTLDVTGEVGDLAATIGTEGGTLDVSSAIVSGKALEIAFDATPFGMPGEIQFTLDIDGDRATGSGTSPMGPFTLTGRRTARPESEPEVIR